MTLIVALADALPTRSAGYWGVDAGTSETDARAIRNGDVGTSGELRWDALPLRAYTSREFTKAQVHAGDIVLTTSGNCGNAAYVGVEPAEPTVATNFVRILRTDPEVAYSRYVFHFLRTTEFASRIAAFVRGATIKNLPVEMAFAAIRISLPSLPEQRRIAAILDQADALRAKRREVVARFDSLVEAVFHSMFAGREDPVYRLDSIVDRDDRMNYGVVQPGGDCPGGVPLIRVSNLAAGAVDRREIKHISTAIESTYVRSRIRGNEILVSCVGSIGLVSVVSAVDIGGSSGFRVRGLRSAVRSGCGS